ncbi:MAG TPA: hypothetical protein PKE57_01280 [Cellvibrionaceae bacterium]|nr:hypothetical protein [Cellvibrionaceae bacterium]HMW48128.1 hypothetical protein [Cellvibrionaceae bacterium]HMW72605.1 hypothetical protein [Cellvibrionaceae bacterium]HMY40311.1 hypothetical protein [Marinagarivorans sp.]HNG59529.1 hypothetical protein [Cellvibrionaceae bacterium]
MTESVHPATAAPTQLDRPVKSLHPGLVFIRQHWLTSLALALSLLVLALALGRLQQARGAFAQEQARYRQQLSSHQSAAANANLLAAYQAPYAAFISRGHIGAAQRLQWVEALSWGVNHLAVPQVRFTLEPTLPATLDKHPAGQVEGLSLTPMRLDFTLLHEGDFYRLLQDLRSRALGLFSVPSCTLRRKDAGSIESSEARAQNPGEASRIVGECELLWYNLQPIADPPPDS